MNTHWLAEYFVVMICEKSNENTGRLNSALRSLDHFMSQGWNLNDIKNELDQFKWKYPDRARSVYHLEEIIGNKIAPQTNNLMDPDIFYYHNQLRITSAPSRIVYNRELRKYEKKEEPFFLEMKPAFYMEDLLQYWYSTNKIEPNQTDIKKDAGRFDHLLKSYDLDEVLFMIDITRDIRNVMKLRKTRNVFEIEKYIDEAKEAIEQKANVHKLQGIDRVFPRGFTN